MAAANKEVVAALSGTTTIIIILVPHVQTMKSLSLLLYCISN